MDVRTFTRFRHAQQPQVGNSGKFQVSRHQSHFHSTTRELLPSYIPTYLTLGLIKLSSFFFCLVVKHWKARYDDEPCVCVREKEKNGE